MLKKLLINCGITIGLIVLLFIMSIVSDGYARAIEDIGPFLKDT